MVQTPSPIWIFPSQMLLLHEVQCMIHFNSLLNGFPASNNLPPSWTISKFLGSYSLPIIFHGPFTFLLYLTGSCLYFQTQLLSTWVETSSHSIIKHWVACVGKVLSGRQALSLGSKGICSVKNTLVFCRVYDISCNTFLFLFISSVLSNFKLPFL